MKVCCVDKMREMDKLAIEQFSIPEEILMENAGLAASAVIQKELRIEGNKFLIICAMGNNGGDGLVVARKIHSMGGDVRIHIFGDKSKFKGASKRNLNIIIKIGLSLQENTDIKLIKQDILWCDVIIDALFGTGLAREISGEYNKVVRLINESKKVIISLDIPSGISGDTGGILGVAVKSNYTVTFGLPKWGNLLYPGYANCGKLYVTHISFPKALLKDNKIKEEVNIPLSLPMRNSQGHKGFFGDVLFIAGAAQYYGAPYFSALSFLKAGGGYSRLAAPKSIIPHIGVKGSEIVFVPQQETVSGSISLKNKDILLKVSELVDMVVIGPGLSLDNETQRLVCELTEKISKPILLDGDGITAICNNLDIIKKKKHPVILTPHPGEMARITGLGLKEIINNRINILKEYTEKLGSIIVLKGAHTLIGLPDKSIYINLSGNSGMATAGSGDVLTGTISAMYGLGLPLEDAVKTGVFVHGLSGDLAAGKLGEDGITAKDIMEYLPFALIKYRTDYQKIIHNYYNKIFVL